MGEVYRARDTRLNRDVALKVLPEDLARDPGRRQRFEQEARAVAALNHPNIVAVYDVGENYFVSELVDGDSLRASARCPRAARSRWPCRSPRDSPQPTLTASRIATSSPKTSW